MRVDPISLINEYPDHLIDTCQEEPPPEQHECPNCGHIENTDDGLGCDYCCPELADVDDDDALSYVT